MNYIFTTENILFYFFSIIFWPFSYYCISLFHQKPEIIKNFTHLFHAILFVSLYKVLDFNNINYPIVLSIGFYTCDIFYIIYSLFVKKDTFLRHLPYLVHHLIANYGLYIALSDYCREQIIYFYYILEYSNFLLYTGYHIQKEYSNNKNLLLVSVSFQFVWYTYFRVIRFLLYLFQIRELFVTVYVSIQLITIILFGMGAYWSWSLFQKNLFLLQIEQKLH